MVNISKDAIQVWRLTLQIDELFDIMESKKKYIGMISKGFSQTQQFQICMILN